MLKKRGPALKGDAKISPAETSMDSAVKPNKSNNYNPPSLIPPLPSSISLTRKEVRGQ